MLARMWKKREPSYIIGGNVNWKTVWRFFKKPKIELPYDPSISLLGVNLKKKTKTLI